MTRKMQKHLYIFAILLFVFNLSAQEETNSTMMFNQFQKAQVFYKDQSVCNSDINYDLRNKRFVFIDDKDGNKIKKFAHPEKVLLFKIGERNFYVTPNGPKEMLLSDPDLELYVIYQINNIGKGAPIGYGEYSEITANRHINSFENDYTGYGGRETPIEGSNCSKSIIFHRYEVVIKGKKKYFGNEKQFLKLFPEKKELLQKYINKNVQSFDSINQVSTLLNYVMALRYKLRSA